MMDGSEKSAEYSSELMRLFGNTFHYLNNNCALLRIWVNEKIPITDARVSEVRDGLARGQKALADLEIFLPVEERTSLQRDYFVAAGELITAAEALLEDVDDANKQAAFLDMFGTYNTSRERFHWPT